VEVDDTERTFRGLGAARGKLGEREARKSEPERRDDPSN
jgi:hypothetical protein